ncbi:MAG: uracil-DNA glycosylase [Candidatus Wallbacteria bacterium]|nr:uracil-DNA glycosylase [Candidatus Wallbacteria bacterium]
MPDVRPSEEENAALNAQLESLRSACERPMRCTLCRTRTKFVFGEGSPAARLMLVGEGPGEQEDLSGRPFVGPAGQLLDKVLESVGFARSDVYITNVVKCRPPGNRTPTDQEMAECGPILLEQIRIIRPRLIGMLGNVAKSFFLGKTAPGITRCQGQFFDWKDGIQLQALYHPSFLLRNQQRTVGSPKWQTWQSMKELRRRYDALVAGQTPAAPPPATEPGQQSLF